MSATQELIEAMALGRAWSAMGDSEAVRTMLGRVYGERYHSAAYHRDRFQIRVNMQKKDDAEERGLGGARSLDGLAWDLSIDAVWEAWVAAFSADLAGRLGLTASPFQEARRVLRWQGPASSMGALAPDVELRGADRVIWIDAKYKAHLELLARRGWSGLTDEVREAHRADLHQALAYASLADVPQVDSLLVYPQLGGHDSAATIATVTSGRRRVRLVLASVPFGYRNPDHQERCLRSFRELLAA